MKHILKISLLITFITLSNITFVPRVIEMVNDGKIINAIIFCCIWGFSLTAIFVGSYLSGRFFRVLFGLLICFSTFAGMTYFGISNHFLNFEDMELLWISKEHASKVFSFYLDFMIWPFFLSIIGFVGVTLNTSPIRVKGISVKVLNVFSLTPFLILALISYQKGGYGTKSMPMQYTTISTFFLFQTYDLFLPGMSSERLEIDLSLEKASRVEVKHIVFIIDESIRSDYVNFKPNNLITPYISSNLDRFISFGDSSSANNCSGYSNAVLRLGGIKSDLESIGLNPTIWSYAKKAGYETFYLDGQLKNGELQNFMGGSELSSIDNFVQFNNTPDSLLDHTIANKLRTIINSNTPSFVYVNKRGAHFPYIESYDQSKAIFLPQMEASDKLGDNKEKYINAYKNSVAWNVDKFFEILLNKIDLSSTIIFYTSDHGQNLLDRGIQTHCNTVEPHPFEGFVPAAIITDIPILKQEYTSIATSRKGRITHFHFFPEIIKRMGFRRAEVLEKYGVDFLNGDIKQEFSAGALLPRFGKEVNWYPIR